MVIVEKAKFKGYAELISKPHISGWVETPINTICKMYWVDFSNPIYNGIWVTFGDEVHDENSIINCRTSYNQLRISDEHQIPTVWAQNFILRPDFTPIDKETIE